jgi:hypothetical protein
VTVPEQNNLEFPGATHMNYSIGDYNKNLFIGINTQTLAAFPTFPGFKLNDLYRVYINYFNAANVQQNQAGGQVEQSLQASPLLQASPPLVCLHKMQMITLLICQKNVKMY